MKSIIIRYVWQYIGRCVQRHYYPRLTKASVSSSFEKSERAEDEKDETIFLVDDLFKVEVISYEVHLKEETVADKDQQTHRPSMTF